VQQIVLFNHAAHGVVGEGARRLPSSGPGEE
jgi:hypothetical protein